MRREGARQHIGIKRRETPLEGREESFRNLLREVESISMTWHLQVSQLSSGWGGDGDGWGVGKAG